MKRYRIIQKHAGIVPAILTMQLFLAGSLAAFGQGAPVPPPADPESGAAEAKGGKERMGLEAQMKTSKGMIVLTLFPEDAPITVANFVNLANRKYYDGILFHRVIPDFMIQGGDPTGTGRGGPGYKFEDEFQSGRKFDKKGLLAMANAGPGTNGSQFFITHVPTPHLNNRHTIFGEVETGQEIVDAIAQGDKIVSLEIIGDATSLLDSMSEKIASWNQTLDSK